MMMLAKFHVNRTADGLADGLDKLARAPRVNSTIVGVEGDAGVVTLTGRVDRSVTRLAAERAALRVGRARAGANSVTVRGPFTDDDTDLATAVVNALGANELIPPDRLDVTVENDKVTLRGTLDRAAQVGAAISAVRALPSVRHVVSLLQVKQPVASAHDSDAHADIV